jgi:hypothetical protein
MTAVSRSVAVSLVVCVGLAACGASDSGTKVDYSTLRLVDSRELTDQSTAVVEPIGNFVIETKRRGVLRGGSVFAIQGAHITSRRWKDAPQPRS